jgi:hypothetical protein
LRKLVIVALTLLLMVGYGSAAFAAQSIKLSDAANGITLLERDQTGITVKVTVGSLDVAPVNTKAGSFTLLTGESFDHSSLIGEPSVPVNNQLIAIPLGCELTTEVLSSQVQEISLADFGVYDRILPVQPSLSKSENPATVPFEYKQDIYDTPGYYQLPAASAEVVGIMRNVRLGRLSVAPVEYNVAENRIKVYAELVIRVHFNNADWGATQDLFSSAYSPAFEPALSMVMNSDASTFGLRDDLSKYPLTMVIVSDRMFEAQLAPFIAWKVKKGFKVIVGYTDVVGNTTAAIKTYLQNLYNTESPKPTYVVLMGDIGQIPTWAGTAGSHPTDLRYCEYTGDNVPEVYYGRMSATNTTQMQPQIDKTLEYEQYLMPDPSYLAHDVLIAGVDGTYAVTYGNGQINYGTNNYFNTAHSITPHVWLYPASDAAGAAAAVIAQVNSGVSFANYTAHGGETGWSDPAFSVSDVATMTNNHKYGLLVGNCCVTGSYDYSTNCFGEALLQKAGGGSIGYIGASNNSYWDEDYWWGVGGGKAIVAAGPPYDATKIGAYDGTFHEHGEPTTQWYTTQGAMNYCGLLAVEQSSSTRKQYYWEMYNLLGDPSVTNYMRVPSTNAISHLPSMLMTSTTFSVTAEAGSYVAMSTGGVLHGAGLVPSGGSLALPVSAFGAPCTANLVITRQDRVPYQATVQVIAPNGPYIVYDAHTINDAAGNNNGQIDFGENILLGMQLINVGPDQATGVLAELSTIDGYVNITDATENYGTMAGNMTVKNIANAFAFTVDPATPDGHSVRFDVTVHGTAKDSVWTSFFNVTTHAPSVAYLSVTVNDAAGNNNGIIDPGETVPIVITLQNSGSGQAFNVAATLSELDDYVSIVDNAGTFGNIAGGGGTASNSANTFTVQADPTCPMGHALLAKLSITADGNYSTSSNFNLVIGDRVVFFLEDFTVEQGWEGLGTTAQWQIGPAIGGSNGSYPADPTDDHTAGTTNMILGNNLGNPGSYANSIAQTYWCNSPIIDCSNASGVQLSYWHQLGCESSSYDHSYFEVFDGENWVNLFTNSATLDEALWTESQYDIAQYADGNPLFQLRWGLGSTDGSQVHGGWNIDDIQLKGYVSSSSGASAYMFAPQMVADSLVGGDSSVINVVVNSVGQSNLRIRLSSPVSWMSCPGTQNIVPPGESVTIPVTIRTNGTTPGMNTSVLNFTSNVPGHTTGSIPAELYVYIPQIVTSPSTVAAWIDSGLTTTKRLVIDNPGPGRLTYAVSCNTDKTGYVPPTPQVPLGTRIGDPDKTGYVENYYAPMTKGSGGPDAFGYTWKDSDQLGGPTFNWVEIATTGTDITTGLTDDGYVGPFPIGFTFPFYSSNQTQFYISGNGMVGFNSTSLGTAGNATIPTAATPNDIIAWFWDDLNIADADNPGGKIYYQVVDGNLVIEFKKIPDYDYNSNPGDTITAQVILTPAGKITIQYQGLATVFDVTGATIGIENSTGTDGLQVVYNAAYVHTGLAIEFKNPNDTWLSATPASGFVNPHSKDTVDVSFTSVDCVDSTYDGVLTLVTNVPTAPIVNIPVAMHVGVYHLITATAAAHGSISPDGEVGVVPGGSQSFAITPAQDYRIAKVVVDGDSVGVGNSYLFSNVTTNHAIEAFFTEATNPGDADGNGVVDISDAVWVISFIFGGGPAPIPLSAGDADCSGACDISDAVYLIAYIFTGGPAPCQAVAR